MHKQRFDFNATHTGVRMRVEVTFQLEFMLQNLLKARPHLSLVICGLSQLKPASRDAINMS